MFVLSAARGRLAKCKHPNKIILKKKGGCLCLSLISSCPWAAECISPSYELLCFLALMHHHVFGRLVGAVSVSVLNEAACFQVSLMALRCRLWGEKCVFKWSETKAGAAETLLIPTFLHSWSRGGDSAVRALVCG